MIPVDPKALTTGLQGAPAVMTGMVVVARHVPELRGEKQPLKRSFRQKAILRDGMETSR